MKFFLKLMMLLLIACSLACGKNYTNSSLDQQRDREREAANLLSKDYAELAGQYQSTPEDKSGYKISAELELTYVQREGSMVPQPTISGSISLKSKSSSPLTFSFVNGTYDSASSNFAARISGFNTEGVSITCKFTRDDKKLNCRWIPASSGSERFTFILKRVQ